MFGIHVKLKDLAHAAVDAARADIPGAAGVIDGAGDLIKAAEKRRAAGEPLLPAAVGAVSDVRAKQEMQGVVVVGAVVLGLYLVLKG